MNAFAGISNMTSNQSKVAIYTSSSKRSIKAVLDNVANAPFQTLPCGIKK